LLREGFAELRAENAALRARIALTAPDRSTPRTQSCGSAPSREARPIQGLSRTSLRPRPTVTERNVTVHRSG
jgi:hypothetical protein